LPDLAGRGNNFSSAYHFVQFIRQAEKNKKDNGEYKFQLPNPNLGL